MEALLRVFTALAYVLMFALLALLLYLAAEAL
jgi:hypothetical protein